MVPFGCLLEQANIALALSPKEIDSTKSNCRRAILTQEAHGNKAVERERRTWLFYTWSIQQPTGNLKQLKNGNESEKTFCNNSFVMRYINNTGYTVTIMSSFGTKETPETYCQPSLLHSVLRNNVSTYFYAAIINLFFGSDCQHFFLIKGTEW